MIAYTHPYLVALIAWATFVVSTAMPSAAQSNGEAASAEREDTFFAHTFGTPGDVGFRVWFEKTGGAIYSVQLLDHDDLGAEPDEKGHRPPYTILNRPQSGWFNFTLEDISRGIKAFPGIELFAQKWEVVEQSPRAVRFELDTGAGVVLERAYRWEPGRRDLQLDLTLRSTDSVGDLAGRYLPLRLYGGALPNPKRNYVLGANPSVIAAGFHGADGAETEIQRTSTHTGESVSGVVARADEVGTIDFGGTTNRFFCSVLYPANEDSAIDSVGFQLFPNRSDDVEVPPYTVPMPLYQIGFEIPVAGASTTKSYYVYLGPKSKRVFRRTADGAYATEYSKFDPIVNFDLSPAQCFCTIPGAQQTARFLLWVLGLIQDIVGNWGIAIVILTICVRGALVPLNFRMQKAMRAYGHRAAKAAPQMEKLKERFKDDPKQLQMEMLKFQRENKLFPPVGGCLPLFVTIPIFIGLFSALRASYDLRGQALFWWVDDLSQPDQLTMLFGYPLNLLPLLWMSLTFYLQSQAPLPKDPQQRQVMQIMRFMPLMFGFLLYNYASGLMVYMLTSGSFALVETRVVKRLLGPMPESPMGAGPMPI